ncbi:MAG: hypothetical protein MZW92_05230 [Comamonadaceae bacterium]|nr:hypothetical protein [Comamonadaceae bacterium]
MLGDVSRAGVYQLPAARRGRSARRGRRDGGLARFESRPGRRADEGGLSGRA